MNTDNAYSLLTYEDFTYKSVFSPALTPEEYIEGRDIALAMWSGVLEMWGACEVPVRDRKRSAVANLLVAWYLADRYPTRLTSGIQSSGGMPISRKRIREVDISYSTLHLPEAYDALASNQFGVKAAMLIRYAPDMMGVYG